MASSSSDPDLSVDSSSSRLLGFRRSFRREDGAPGGEPGGGDEAADSKLERLTVRHQQLAAVGANQQRLFRDFAKLSRAMAAVSELLAQVSARLAALREATNAPYPGLHPLLTHAESFFLALSKRQEELEFAVSQAALNASSPDPLLSALERAVKKRERRQLDRHLASLHSVESAQVCLLLDSLPRLVANFHAFHRSLAAVSDAQPMLACLDAAAASLAAIQSGACSPSNFHLDPSSKKVNLRPVVPTPVVQLSRSGRRTLAASPTIETRSIPVPTPYSCSTVSVVYSSSKTSVQQLSSSSSSFSSDTFAQSFDLSSSLPLPPAPPPPSPLDSDTDNSQPTMPLDIADKPEPPPLYAQSPSRLPPPDSTSPRNGSPSPTPDKLQAKQNYQQHIEQHEQHEHIERVEQHEEENVEQVTTIEEPLRDSGNSQGSSVSSPKNSFSLASPDSRSTSPLQDDNGDDDDDDDGDDDVAGPVRSRSISPAPPPRQHLPRCASTSNLDSSSAVAERIEAEKPVRSDFPTTPFVDDAEADASAVRWSTDDSYFTSTAADSTDLDDELTDTTDESSTPPVNGDTAHALSLSLPSLPLPSSSSSSEVTNNNSSPALLGDAPQPQPQLLSSQSEPALANVLASTPRKVFEGKPKGFIEFANQPVPLIDSNRHHSVSTSSTSLDMTSSSSSGSKATMAGRHSVAISGQMRDVEADSAPVAVSPDLPDLKFMTRDGQTFVRAASFERLVERLTHPALSDPSFRKAMLNTFPLFTSAHELLTALIGRFAVEVQGADKELHLIRLRVIGAVQAWLGIAPYVLKDESFVQRLHDFLAALAESPVHARIFLPQALQIRHLVARKIEKQQQQERRAQQLQQVLASSAAAVPPPMSLLSAEFDVRDAAELLTLIDSEYYCNIFSIELLLYVKSGRKDVDAPNIFVLIDTFNRLSSWLVSEIVSLPRVDDRGAAIEKAIALGAALFALNNLNGTVAVTSALASAGVRRLRRSWSLVSAELQSKLTELEEIFCPDYAYRAFRDFLRNASPPCIPYLGIFLTDMTFVQEGNPSTVDGLINFAKFHKIFQLVQQLQNYQEPYVDLQKKLRHSGDDITPLERHLRTLPRFDEGALYNRSTLVEPKDWEFATEKWMQIEARLAQRVRELEAQLLASTSEPKVKTAI